MACVAVSESDDAIAKRGHQLAKYLSCCGAAQCAETHICSRRVARAGAAACKHCGGAGGGSEWAKAFAAALCDVFDCPTMVRREALDLVVSAVAFASWPSPSPPRAVVRGGLEGDGGSGGVGGGAPGYGGDDAAAAAAAAAAAGDGNESCCSSSSNDGGLGSSWESVSELTSACGPAGGSGYGCGFGNGDESGSGGSGGGDNHDDDDDDDEVVRKGIWFPLPSTADAKDPLLASTSTVSVAAASSSSTDSGRVRRLRPIEATRSGGNGRTASAVSGRRNAPSSGPAGRAAATAAAATTEEAGRRRRRTEARGLPLRTSPPPPAPASSAAASTLAGRLRLWHRGSGRGDGGSSGSSSSVSGITSPPSAPSTSAPPPLRVTVAGTRPEQPDPPPPPPAALDGGGGGGETGSEFVVLVSREATVRELAESVGGFPQEWLGEALGLVVRRQVEGAMYDARARAAMKRAVRLLDGRVSWKQVAVTEKELAALHVAQDPDGRIQDGDQNKEAAVSGRYWKVGLAAAGGGVLLFLSGGVAAPSVTASLSAVGYAAANSVSYVAPSLGAWLGYTSTTSAAAAAAAAAATSSAVSGAGSVGAFSAVSGAAGAGVAGYKMTRRTAGVQEFHFLPLHSNWPLDSPESMFEGASEPGLPVFICIPGWHEPGHDPRHTWGGIGYAAATPDTATATVAAAAATTTVGATAAAAAVGDDAKQRREGVVRPAPNTVPAAAAAAAAAAPAVAPAAEFGVTTGSGRPKTTASAAARAGGAVSRWLSAKTVGGVDQDGSRSSSGGGGRGEGGGRYEALSHRDQDPRSSGPNGDAGGGSGSGAGAGASSAPMASSFIDLGSSRGTRISSSSGGGGGGGGGAFEHGAPRRERESEGEKGGQRRRNRPREEPIAEGNEAEAAGDDVDTAEMEDSWEALPSHAWWRDFVSGGEEHVLVWERGPLTELHAAMRDLAWKKASRRAVNEALKRSALAPVVAAAAIPLALLEAASGLDDPWGVVRTRALEAGRLLAAVLLSRPVGCRPVTLLGFSMGAKVVFNCLEALAAAPDGRGLGIVENAVMLGTPIGTKRGRWKRARSAVAGRLINGYSSRDWLLALVYRSKSWSVGVAGTSRVEDCGVENLDLSGLVTWHLNYSRILPTVMAMLRLEE